MMGLKQEIKRRQSVAAGALLPGLPQRFEGVMPQLGPAQAQAAPSSNQSQSDNSQVRQMIDVELWPAASNNGNHSAVQ